jgi:hypothetical protein
MKKWIKIVLIAFSLLSVVWILYIYLKSSPKNAPEIVPSKPILIQTYKGSLSMSLGINESQFKYIDKLPFLNVSRKSITDDYANGVASSLGFSIAPVKIDDTQEGLTYFWKNDNATLFVYTKSSKIRYSSGKSFIAPNKQLSENAVKSTAEKLLIDNKILNPGNFSLGSVQFLKERSLNEGFIKSTKEDFSLYQISVLPKSTDYQIISPVSTESASYIQLTKDGDIYSFQLVVFESTEKAPTEYKLKTYSEIKTSIGNSVLISLGGEETPLKDLPKDFVNNIVVDQVDISYLLDSPTSTSLQPVYKLTGTATLSGGGKTEAILYLPALSGL